MDSLQESFQLVLPSFERREIPMDNSMCMEDYDGKGYDQAKQVLFSDLSHSFTMFLQAMTPKWSNISCISHGIC